MVSRFIKPCWPAYIHGTKQKSTIIEKATCHASKSEIKLLKILESDCFSLCIVDRLDTQKDKMPSVMILPSDILYLVPNRKSWADNIPGTDWLGIVEWHSRVLLNPLSLKIPFSGTCFPFVFVQVLCPFSAEIPTHLFDSPTSSWEEGSDGLQNPVPHSVNLGITFLFTFKVQ